MKYDLFKTRLLNLFLFIYIKEIVSDKIVGNVYKSLEGEIGKEIYFQDLSYASYNNQIISKINSPINMTINSTIIAELSSVVYDINDMHILQYNEDDSNSTYPLEFHKDIWLNVSISQYARPNERYTSYDTKLYANTPGSLKSPFDSKVNCTFSGEGVTFDLEINDTPFNSYDINGYLTFSFALNNTKLVCKDADTIDIHFIPINDYIKRLNPLSSNEDVSNVMFDDIWVDKHIYEKNGILVAKSNDKKIYLWELVSSNGVSIQINFLFKFNTADTSFFDRINIIGFYNSTTTKSLIVGVKNVGYAFYDIITDKKRGLQAPIINNPNNVFASSALNSLTTGNNILLKNYTLDNNFLTFKINKITLYVIVFGEGLKILDLQSSSYIKTIKHPRMKSIDHIEMPLNIMSNYIGISLDNDPNTSSEAYFIELDLKDERNPLINKIFTSKLKTNYDNFITTINKYSMMFDKLNNRIIILYRGVANLLDVPSFVIPSNLQINKAMPALIYNVYTGNNIIGYQSEYIISHNNAFIHLKDFSGVPFVLKCSYNRLGSYDMQFNSYLKCDSQDAINGSADYCLYSFFQDINVFDNSALTYSSDNNSSKDKNNSRTGLIAIIILISLAIITLIIFFILYKKGIIFKKQNNNNNNNNNIQYKNPQVQASAVNQQDGGEIEINVKHQILEDDKI